MSTSGAFGMNDVMPLIMQWRRRWLSTDMFGACGIPSGYFSLVDSVGQRQMRRVPENMIERRDKACS